MLTVKLICDILSKIMGSYANKVLGGVKMRVAVKLACTECKQRNYDTEKNKKENPERIELNKYCKFCKKHTLHKETK